MKNSYIYVPFSDANLFKNDYVRIVFRLPDIKKYARCGYFCYVYSLQDRYPDTKAIGTRVANGRQS